ncbi:MAG TPA: O-antigen ligase family protein [Vicinamibacterales bacterium]|nr:O-antigen ligase family protein [Vicinamibacterales bacterium]
MSRFTKLVVIFSNLIAVWLLAWQVSKGLPPILGFAMAAFAASCVCAVVVGDLATTIVLSLIYFVPALCFAWFKSFAYSYYAIWMAALCGAMIPRGVRSEWGVPRRWKAPLVLWALVLALSWPIILLREVDFVPALLDNPYLANSRLWVFGPGVVVLWVLSVASIATTALLLLDWLFLAYPADKLERFESHVIWPLCAGAGVAAAVAVFQMFVDLSFLNRTLFWSLGRAVGTMRDANAFGTVVALWVPIVAALVVGTRRLPAKALGCIVFVIFGLGVWASGSRTALLAALVGLGILLAGVWRSLTIRQWLGAAGACVALAAAIALFPPSSTSGPWRRIVQFLPELSEKQIVFSAERLWSRDMYGLVADRMIAEHPAVGIGIGGYNYQYADILYLMNGTTLPTDNAQNWYRQQLAELGLLGSVGWIAWASIFIWMLVVCHGSDPRRILVSAVKGAVVGLGVASLLGMPTQDTAASITFVVLAAWCLKLVGADGPGRSAELWPVSFEWPTIALVLISFIGGTLYEARTDLRPPVRATRAEFPYKYGFAEPDGKNSDFQWTEKKAVDVFPIGNRWMRLVLGSVAPDAAEKPVEVKVWRNDELILRLRRRSDFPLERWIRLSDHEKFVRLEIEVGRTWRPVDFGRGLDRQERGVEVGKQEFAYWPPAGAVTIDLPSTPHENGAVH